MPKAKKDKKSSKIKDEKKMKKAKKVEKISKKEKPAKSDKKAKVEKKSKKTKNIEATNVKKPKMAKGKLQVTVVSEGVRVLIGKITSSENGCATITHKLGKNTIETIVPMDQVLMKTAHEVFIKGSYVINQFFALSVEAKGDVVVYTTEDGKVMVNPALCTVSADKLVESNEESDDEEEEEDDEPKAKKSKGKKAKDEDDDEEWNID